MEWQTLFLRIAHHLLPRKHVTKIGLVSLETGLLFLDTLVAHDMRCALEKNHQ